jgi:predicted permease
MGSALRRDLIAASRSIRRRPAFSAVVIATLALGIGVNTAIFSVVDRVLLRRLPFAEADRLMAVYSREPGSDRQPFSIPDFRDLSARARSLDALVGWASSSVNLTGIEEPVVLRAQWTTAGFFALLGIKAALGRTPLPEEEQPGAPRVVLLGDALWRSRFGSSPDIVGKTLSLNGEPVTVIGVLPRDFLFLAANADLAGPMVIQTDARRDQRGSGFLRLIGRLRPGATAAGAAAELDAVVQDLRGRYPETNANKQGVSLQRLGHLVVGDYRRKLLILQAAVGVVLLIVCTNLSNLLLACISARRGELALHRALGARRSDLARQILAESTGHALLGGVLGLAVSWAGVRALLLLAPAPIPRAAEIRVDPSALAFHLGLSLLAGLAMGIVPALQGSRGLSAGLRGGGRGQTDSPRGARTRGMFVTAEVALSLMLLTGAALLLRTLQRFGATDLGFSFDHLLVAQLSLPKRRYASPEVLARFAEESTSRIASLPGVAQAAATSLNPLTQWRANISFLIEGRPELDPRRAPLANYRAVGPDYFKTLGVPLRAGREIDPRDRADSEPVGVISETLARLYFRGASPTGARLRIDDRQGWRTVEIVGVVGDVKFTGLDAQGTADLYVPYTQTPPEVSVWLANIFCLAVRTQGDPRLLANAVGREIHTIDRDVAIASIRPMSEAVGASLAERRFHTLLLEIFGAAAFALALAGIHAVTAFAVIERTREIGVRISLGSGPARIVGLIVGQALKPVGVGVVLGAAAALASSRLIAGLLFGVAPNDLPTFALTMLAVGLAACLAAAVPGLRASRIDPVRALRAE